MSTGESTRIDNGLAYCLAQVTGGKVEERKLGQLAVALASGDQSAAFQAAEECQRLPGCDGPCLCLVGFDLPGIQERIFDTSKRPVIRATSERIRNACREVVNNLAAKTGLPASCVIFSGGGQGVLLAPQKDAERVRQFVQETFTGKKLENLTCERLDFAPRQLASTDALPSALKNKLGLEGLGPVALLRQLLGARLEANRKLVVAKRLPADVERCAWCRIRPAEKEGIGPRHEFVCRECSERYRQGRELKEGEADDFQGVIEGFGLRAPRQHSLAILYADGNNIGGVLERLQTLRQFQVFSKKLDEAVQKGVDEVAGKFPGLQDGKHLIKLLVGGDDALLLLPGSIALEFACELSRYVEQAFTPPADEAGEELWQAFPPGSPAREEVAGLGLSVGVVFADPSFPIRMMLRYARECLKSAKERAHREHRLVEAGNTRRQAAAVRSYIDFICVDKGTHVGTALQEDRRRRLQATLEGRPVLLTERPYSLPEAQLLIEEVRLLQKTPTSQVYDLRQLLLDTPEVGTMHVEYQLARSKEWRNFCKKLESEHRQSDLGYTTASPVSGVGLATWRRRPGSEQTATPIVDWLELRDRLYLADKEGR